MTLSQVAKTIGESATLKLNALAARLQQQGEPVIHLGGGEPKSKAPPDALKSAAALLETGEVRYTPADGTRVLKQAIIKYTEQFYGCEVAPENVMASSGAKQAILVALQAVLNPGDEVLYPAPYWVSYPEMCKLIGAVGVAVKASDGGFQPSLRDLESHISPKTRAIILNSPNNPSGAVYAPEFVAEVVALCERRELWLVMDDIYHRLIFDGRQPTSACAFAKQHGEASRLIIINGVSKLYAMTGFRLGWAVANRALVAAMTNIQGHQTSGPSALSQQAAVGALNGSQACVDALRASLEGSRNLLIDGLKKLDRVRLAAPGGTFYSFPDFSAYEPSSMKLAQMILERAKVVTVPGVEFGLEGHLRISFCGGAEDIRQGVERLKWALDTSGPSEIVMAGKRMARTWQ
jgi:aspartate aminotransferase